MKIIQMIDKLSLSRKDIAKEAGISVEQLNNMVSLKVEVDELPDGSFVVVRGNAVRFNKVS
jgi:hypothetical protein